MPTSTIEPRIVPDGDYRAHERSKACPPGYIDTACVGCRAAIFVPDGTLDPRCTRCIERRLERERAAWDQMNDGERFDGME